ncbi:hypothetical protein ILYODFUR_007103 [Ilyodon furcidens]|uniref:Uncharacterized protein n=1 Tax=Ilyodon furcidens TaxID=33524 RepID=A0ABV0UDZ9_9TELE
MEGGLTKTWQLFKKFKSIPLQPEPAEKKHLKEDGNERGWGYVLKRQWRDFPLPICPPKSYLRNPVRRCNTAPPQSLQLAVWTLFGGGVLATGPIIPPGLSSGEASACNGTSVLPVPSIFGVLLRTYSRFHQSWEPRMHH